MRYIIPAWLLVHQLRDLGEEGCDLWMDGARAVSGLCVTEQPATA